MDYSNQKIDAEILELAKDIKENVPYWLHYRPVNALKSALKKCQSLERSSKDSMLLSHNKEIILYCLNLLTPRQRF